MSKQNYELTFDLIVKSVNCPGVWLCPNGLVTLSLKALGNKYKTQPVKPMFPLLFNKSFSFKKQINGVDSSGMQDSLEKELVYCELVQWLHGVDNGKGKILATYCGILQDILFTPDVCISSKVDLLMKPGKVFPGILAPKIELLKKLTMNDKTSIANKNKSLKNLESDASKTSHSQSSEQSYSNNNGTDASRNVHDNVTRLNNKSYKNNVQSNISDRNNLVQVGHARNQNQRNPANNDNNHNQHYDNIPKISDGDSSKSHHVSISENKQSKRTKKISLCEEFSERDPSLLTSNLSISSKEEIIPRRQKPVCHSPREIASSHSISPLLEIKGDSNMEEFLHENQHLSMGKVTDLDYNLRSKIDKRVRTLKSDNNILHNQRNCDLCSEYDSVFENDTNLIEYSIDKKNRGNAIYVLPNSCRVNMANKLHQYLNSVL